MSRPLPTPLILRRTIRKVNTLSDAALGLLDDYRARRLADAYCIGSGYRRVYHYHIPKTGGTSLNNIFLSLADQSGPIQSQLAEGNRLYHQLGMARDHRVIVGDKVFVGWNERLIEAGSYFYAFSHTPQHKLTLPRDTFTVTCVRNPVDRVLSRYKALLYYRENEIAHPIMQVEGDWLGSCFGDYLSNAPRESLLYQLYMFSEEFNVDESVDRIMDCSHFLFTEDFSQGIRELSSKLAIRLECIHIRKSRLDYVPTSNELERLESILKPELMLYAKLKQAKQE